MIVTLLYHRVGSGKYATPLERLEDHFAWIAERYPTLFPGEKLQMRMNLCLTFDDATYDFYAAIYPLLKKYKLRALLCVPTAYILDRAEWPAHRRLTHDDPFTDPHYFCTFDELKEMQESGLVQIASHTHTHLDLSQLTEVALEHELTHSKELLEKKLGAPINTLALPYGRYHRNSLKVAKQHYRYVMRIGNAVNWSWGSLSYRIVADNLPRKDFPFPISPLRIMKSFLNRARGC